MTEAITTSDADRRELIAFRIGKQEFCVDVMSVREIRGWTQTTPLPHSPHFMRGVINLRGAVLPIVDLAARFGLNMTEPTARHVIIVTHIGNRLVGLLVDAVCDILTVARGAIQPAPDIDSEASVFVRGLLPVDGRMISLISLDRMLPSDREAA
jgi:purine-binding chemotaxis protein CheW